MDPALGGTCIKNDTKPTTSTCKKKIRAEQQTRRSRKSARGSHTNDRREKADAQKKLDYIIQQNREVRYGIVALHQRTAPSVAMRNLIGPGPAGGPGRGRGGLPLRGNPGPGPGPRPGQFVPNNRLLLPPPERNPQFLGPPQGNGPPRVPMPPRFDPRKR
ncbi:hypothetical protein VTL71DRAFT_12871 [Oculimacula yallundae]|uniref:Uncharacterized protein n=1 Tax=Oculimacula yallundae TaxID=86028 RepID=A0ABR4CNP7_9HELO